MLDKINITQGTKQTMVPLNNMLAGQEGFVKQIIGGIGFMRKLLNIGIRAGSKIKVINASGGPIIISSEGTKAAIGRGAASRILVEIPSDKDDTHI
ncbi:MAG: FeoA family protein [bacterium]